jgi:hypothetical protein
VCAGFSYMITVEPSSAVGPSLLGREPVGRLAIPKPLAGGELRDATLASRIVYGARGDLCVTGMRWLVWPRQPRSSHGFDLFGLMLSRKLDSL